MEVVLLENIKNLGVIGDVVKVKRGHARNYLIKLLPKQFLVIRIYPRFIKNLQKI